MAFRRRRKPSVLWLPNLGQNQGSTDAWIDGSIAVGPTTGQAGITTTIHSLTLDYPADAIRAGAQIPSLADYQEQGYRLRRVVGKFFASIDQSVGDGDQTKYPEAALVTAGLIVLRVEGTTGAPLNAATPNKYSPIHLDNVQDPWIWRRSWMLSDYQGYAGGGGAHSAYSWYPITTPEYGSVKDGPHVDQKTARRVSAEERLFLVISTACPTLMLTANTAGQVRYTFEYRLLASPLRVTGNRKNASR